MKADQTLQLDQLDPSAMDAGELSELILRKLNLRVHPLAETLPRMAKQPFLALVQNIREHGQWRKAELTEDGMLLIGRHRALACAVLGRKLRTKRVPKGVSLIDYVVSIDGCRRELTASQRAAWAARLVPHYAIQAAERKRELSGTRPNADGSRPQHVAAKSSEPAIEARDIAAKRIAVNAHYVSDALRLQGRNPELFEEVHAGRKSLREALEKIDRRVPESKAEPEPNRGQFVVVLFEGQPARIGKRRLPKELYNAESYPNIALFQMFGPGPAAFALGSGQEDGLKPAAWWAVPDEQAPPGQNTSISWCKSTCRLLTLHTRGEMPRPEELSAPIIANGYEGVLAMIERMWPGAHRLLRSSMTRDRLPLGLEALPSAQPTLAEVLWGVLGRLQGMHWRTAERADENPEYAVLAGQLGEASDGLEALIERLDGASQTPVRGPRPPAGTKRQEARYLRQFLTTLGRRLRTTHRDTAEALERFAIGLPCGTGIPKGWS